MEQSLNNGSSSSNDSSDIAVLTETLLNDSNPDGNLPAPGLSPTVVALNPAGEDTTTLSNNSKEKLKSASPSRQNRPFYVFWATGYEPSRRGACGQKLWALPWHGWWLMAWAMMMNLLLQGERFAVAPHLKELRGLFEVDDKKVALIPMSQTLSMMMSILFGATFGDKIHRVLFIAGSLLVWGCASVTISLIAYVPSNFGLFIFLRVVFGLSSGMFNTLCSTIISDYYSGAQRSVLLSGYMVMTPFGVGASFVFSTWIEQMDDYGMHGVFLLFGCAALFMCLLTVFTIREPFRQLTDTVKIAELNRNERKATTKSRKSVVASMRYIISIPSARWVYPGFTLVAASLAVNAMYLETWLRNLQELQERRLDCDSMIKKQSSIFLGVGIAASGLIAVPVSSILTHCFAKTRCGKAAEGGICSAVTFFGGGLFVAVLCVADRIPLWCTLIALLVLMILLSSIWLPTMEIIMTITVPTQRAFVRGFQVFMGSLFEAIAYFIMGALIKYFNTIESPPERFPFTTTPEPAVTSTNSESNVTMTPTMCGPGSITTFEVYEKVYQRFWAVTHAMQMAGAIALLSSVFYLMTALRLPADRARAVKEYEETLSNAQEKTALVVTPPQTEPSINA